LTIETVLKKIDRSYEGEKGGRIGEMVRRRRWEKGYGDPRGLLSIPPSFRPSLAPIILIYKVTFIKICYAFSRER